MKRTASYWLKLTGLALLLHLILIIISVLEVTFYSYLVNPGHTQEVYEAHAVKSGPYVSAIFGSLLIFLWVRRTAKKDPHNVMHVALALPLLYIALEVVMLFLASVNWNEHYVIFLWANGAKLLAGYLGAVVYARKGVGA
jgi:hypothetical protein